MLTKKEVVKEKKENLAIYLIRIGVAFVFLYAGISALANATNWIGFIPSFVEFAIRKELFLILHGLLDIIIGLWFLYNKGIKYAGILSSVMIFSIILFNLGSFDIIFRDVSILLSIIALTIIKWKD